VRGNEWVKMTQYKREREKDDDVNQPPRNNIEEEGKIMNGKRTSVKGRNTPNKEKRLQSKI